MSWIPVFVELRLLHKSIHFFYEQYFSYNFRKITKKYIVTFTIGFLIYLQNDNVPISTVVCFFTFRGVQDVINIKMFGNLYICIQLLLIFIMNFRLFLLCHVYIVCSMVCYNFQNLPGIIHQYLIMLFSLLCYSVTQVSLR